MLFLLGIITLGYLFFSIWVYRIWKGIKTKHLQYKLKEPLSLDLVVCARNEEENIYACLTSLLQQDYPSDRFHVHFFDDQSEDRTGEIANSLKTSQMSKYNMEFIFGKSFSGSSKKRAIEHICRHSEKELIAVADADCVYPVNWLSNLEDELSPDASLITGPFTYINPSSFLDFFQVFEMAAIWLMSEAGTHKGWFWSASASNMLFRREDFLRTDPYSDNLHIASGDDVFLAKAFVKSGRKIQFARQKESLVLTNSEPDYRSLLNQKVRWGLKLKIGKPDKAYWIWTLVALFNISYLGLGIYISLFAFEFIPVWIICFLAKIFMDLIWVFSWLKYYSLPFSVFNFLLSALLYPFYLTHLSFRLSTIGEIEWKGRKHSA